MHFGVEPVQVMLFPDWVHVLVVEPPDKRYPVKQEYTHMDPKSPPLVQVTLPFSGESSVVWQLISRRSKQYLSIVITRTADLWYCEIYVCQETI